MGLSTVTLFKQLKYEQEGAVVLEGEIMDRYHQCILTIADDIIDVCENNDINYHLCGGSALGAIRHKGFIPWDDDIDLDIESSSFDRFVELFNEKFSDKYWIHTCKTKGYGMTVNRIRLKNSVFRGREDVNNEECGFFVDIMRLENVPDNAALRKLHGFLCLMFGFILSCRNFFKNRELMLDIAGDNKKVRRIFNIKIVIGSIFGCIPVEKLATFTQKVYGVCKNNNSVYVSSPAGRNHYFGEMYKREGFMTNVKAEFEGRSWNVPKDYDGYLSHMYGDYMTVPEVNDREKHILLELKFPEI